MNFSKIATIIRFFSASYSEKDLKNMFLWLNSEKGHHEIHQALDEFWLSIDADADHNIPVDSGKMRTNIQDGIKHRNVLTVRSRLKRLLPYAAILILGGCLFAFYHSKNPNHRKELSDTSVIADNGQRSRIILPDSSVVWLNSGTTISYNNDFARGNRDVRLTGQAFFEVVRNEKVPLVVRCNGLMVDVLGTKFDVHAYPGTHQVRVVLESGSVRLSREGIKTFNYQMVAGELAEFDQETNKMVIQKADVEKYTSWRNGVLIFKNDPMKLVVEKLERWYNIKIEVVDPEVYRSIFTGKVRKESYEQILKLIEYSCPVRCKIKDTGEIGTIPHILISRKD